jgi:hypothetical protein
VRAVDAAQLGVYSGGRMESFSDSSSVATAKRKAEMLFWVEMSRDSMASRGTVGRGRGAIIEISSLLCRRDPSDFEGSKEDVWLFLGRCGG